MQVSSSEQENILLINELSPALEAAEATTNNLNPAQENALQMNAVLQGVSAAASPVPKAFFQETSTAVKGASATVTVSELQNPTRTNEVRGLAGTTETSDEAQGLAPSRTQAATTQVSSAVAAALPPTAVPIPVPLSTVPEIDQPTPPQMPRPDLTPYVLANNEMS